MQLSPKQIRQLLFLTAASVVLYFFLFILPKELRANDRFIRYALLIIFYIFGVVYILVNIPKLYKTILLSIIFMTGFAFVSVPIYNTFCDVTGINGKIDLSLVAGTPEGIDKDREVTVEFVVNHNEQMPWLFKPQHTSLKVHPGAVAKTGYFAKNTTKRTMIAQAVPSIMPPQASKHFKKIECFCFSSQQLGPSEFANLPLRFYLDPKLPKDVKRVTLSYTIFDVTDDPDLQKRHGPHP